MIAIWIVIALFAVGDSAAGPSDPPTPPGAAAASTPAPTATAAATDTPKETAP